jgi:hypothetical protein
MPSIVDNNELANHWVSDTAQDVPACMVCNNAFKKTYFSEKVFRKWQCFVCFQQFDNKSLHVTCFKCDLDVCLSCLKTLKNKNELAQELLNMCECSGTLKLSRPSKPSSSSGFFKCMKCFNMYYEATQRYICESCNIDYCVECTVDAQKDKRKKITVVCVSELKGLEYKVQSLDM